GRGGPAGRPRGRYGGHGRPRHRDPGGCTGASRRARAPPRAVRPRAAAPAAGRRRLLPTDQGGRRAVGRARGDGVRNAGARHPHRGYPRPLGRWSRRRARTPQRPSHAGRRPAWAAREPTATRRAGRERTSALRVALRRRRPDRAHGRAAAQAVGSVTLQVNVDPTDLPHAKSVLPHQLRQWGGQVQEILFTLDLHRTKHGGRFGEAWEERKGPMEELLGELCRQHPHAHVMTVDYGAEAMREVAESFLERPTMPAKDTKGAPVYPYFHGLHTARHELVLHLDSDLMFGGGSQTWVAEACRLLEGHTDVLACS